MTHKLILLFLLAFILSPELIFGQTDELQYDKSVVEIKIPDDKKVNKLKQDKDFIYEEEAEEPVSFWDRLRWWFWKTFMKLFSNDGGWPYVRYTLMILFVLFVISKLLKTDLKSFFIRSKGKKMPDYQILDEDINKLNLNNLIIEAIEKKQYRLATRYLYLLSLKKLSDNELIDWKINKTNRDYINEFSNHKLSSEFIELTNIYEIIWYGNFNIDKDYFNQLKKQYQSFNSIIK